MAETTATDNQTTEATSATEAPATLLATATEVPSTQQQQGEPAKTQTESEGSKPEDGKPAESKVEGAPESYDFKAPEGHEYDATLIGSFSEAAKEANLTQDAAQKLLDKVAPALASRTQEQIAELKNGWTESTKADKEIGGDKLQENLGIAKKAYDAFATPELRKLFEDTGLGNHPEVIRAFVRAGKAISEDSFVSGNPNPKVAVNPADVLYPTMKKE
jgi:hypothetical protein